MSNYLRLYASCIIAEGYLRSMIIDTRAKKYFFIPNELCKMLKKQHIKLSTFFFQKPTNKEFYDFLIKNKLANEITIFEKDRFPKIDMSWDFPAKVTNSIIDINDISIFETNRILKQLYDLGCQYVQFRFFKTPYYSKLFKVINETNKLGFNSIQIIIPEKNSNTITEMIKLANTFNNVHYITIFNCTINKVIKRNVMGNIISTVQDISTNNSCGNINKNDFNVSLKYLSESFNYNICLNRKVSIDTEGNIKNCPSSKLKFGNIRDTKLLDIINKEEFKKMWFAKKDNIDVCKFCEYRYICFDCRIFIKDPENIFSQPSKCYYNPYMAKWKGELGYLPVEECGTYTREHGFVPDKKRINKLNKVLWAE